MKNLVLATIIVFFITALSSCAKHSNIQTKSTAFSINPFTAKSILATAD